jgi:hypothetical protein
MPLEGGRLIYIHDVRIPRREFLEHRRIELGGVPDGVESASGVHGATAGTHFSTVQERDAMAAFSECGKQALQVGLDPTNKSAIIVYY